MMATISEDACTCLDCQYNTEGPFCENCTTGYMFSPWRRSTEDCPFVCQSKSVLVLLCKCMQISCFFNLRAILHVENIYMNNLEHHIYTYVPKNYAYEAKEYGSDNSLLHWAPFGNATPSYELLVKYPHYTHITALELLLLALNTHDNTVIH